MKEDIKDEKTRRLVAPITYGIILWIFGVGLLLSDIYPLATFIYMVFATPIMIFLAWKQSCNKYKIKIGEVENE